MLSGVYHKLEEYPSESLTGGIARCWSGSCLTTLFTFDPL